MKGKKCIGLLTLCITCLLSLNLFSNASAAAITSINFLKAYRVQNELSGEQIFTQTATALPYNFVRIYNSWRNYSIRYFVGSSSIPNPSSGKYFQFVIYNEFVAEQNNSFNSGNCMDLDGYVLPEQGTVVNSSSRTECEVSNNGKTLNVSIITNGSFNTNTTPTSFYWYLDNPNYNLYSCSNLSGAMSTPCFTQYLKLNSQNFRYNYSEDPLVAGQNIIINQNDTIINQNQQIIDQDNEDRNNIEQQSEDTEEQATQAGQTATSTGTTLFAAFSQFFNALTNVSGESCVLPNMQVYSLNLGQMDLCTYDIPPQIMALVSIGMVFIIVPLGIHLVKRMLSLYKEITG